MAMQNRKTLKEYFKTGNLPSEESFSDLIDSMVNIRNDGINRSHEHGFCVVSTGGSDRLLSFFNGDDEREPVWTVNLDNTEKTLCVIHNKNNKKEINPSIIITPDLKIGINSSSPEYDLDVNGTIRSSGRIGSYYCKNGKPVLIAADGEWHDLIENLDGCNMFEIAAGVGKKKSGKYGLMHAIAINIFGNRGKIRYTQSYYLDRNDTICLKWVGNQKGYKLRIRTMSDYGLNNNSKPVYIKCTITKLWFDEYMD